MRAAAKYKIPLYKMIHTVVCTDVNDYVNWQVELLEYSWSRVQQPGSLVRLVACDEDTELPHHRHAQVYKTKPSNVHLESGDIYVCYNRLYSLQQWLNEQDVQGTILIVDCDVVFRNVVREEAEKGQPICQHWVDYCLAGEFEKAVQSITGIANDQLQAATWPALIDADDLRKILPRWIDATKKIREQTKRQESDMFAFLIASREHGLDLQLSTVAAFMPWPDEQVEGAPIVHYCQTVKNERGEYLWSKGNYIPWQRVVDAESAALPYCEDLLNIVDEFARVKQFEDQHSDDKIFIAIAAYCDEELLDTINSCLSKARSPENLRFGICLQYDNDNALTSETCLDVFSQDRRFKYTIHHYTESQGGCWARNIAQQLYAGEAFTLQIDSHTQMVESWDTILIEMLNRLPSARPLITQSPPLYWLENDIKAYQYVDDLSCVSVAIAQGWSREGWLKHTQLLPDKGSFPRHTRLLSGGFVFTSGDWTELVRQDPLHFYTGEELALTVRSFTHGYDLFDPSQIVCWHRGMTTENRKSWNDKPDEEVDDRHRTAISRLNLLLDGDPEQRLGRYGLGQERSLQDYADFSGIDCLAKTINEGAQTGVEIMPIITTDSHTGERMIDVTISLDQLEPLILSCYESTPVLVSLFAALQNKLREPDVVVYLELGQDGDERIVFKAKQILSIQTNPNLSEDFFTSLAAHAQSQTAQEDGNQTVMTPQGSIDDAWKLWIWTNIARGVARDVVFKTLIQNGFSWDIARTELSYQPVRKLDDIELDSGLAVRQEKYVNPPVAKAIDHSGLEAYCVDDFLNAAECDALIDVIHSNLKPSTVVDIESEGSKLSSVRTSQTCHFKADRPEHSFALDVLQRVSEVIGLNHTYAEELQAQLYGEGGEYLAHFDWFDPTTQSFASHASAVAGGQRTWSAIVYLNDVAAGGQTRFENVDITLEPKMGRVVYWNNLDEFGVPSQLALHQACPVEKGEKAVLTIWYRSSGEGDLLNLEPHLLTPRYTQLGLEKRILEKTLFERLATYYHSAVVDNKRDEVAPGGCLENDDEAVPSELIDLPEDIRSAVVAELHPICEQWSGQQLEFSALYGIRVYKPGTKLSMHVDTNENRIISAIINVAQEVEEDWPLAIRDHMQRLHSVVLSEGDLLLYEGARLSHGRPTPFKGKRYANLFVHFRPKRATQT